MIMTAVHLLETNPNPTDDEIKHALEGNLCRCTGYVNIVESDQMGRRENEERMILITKLEAAIHPDSCLTPQRLSAFFEIGGKNVSR